MFNSFSFSFSLKDVVANVNYRTSVFFYPTNENKIYCRVSNYIMDSTFDDPYNGYTSKDEYFDNLSIAISHYLKKYSGFRLSVQGNV